MSSHHWQRLASLKLTLVGLAALAAGVLWAYPRPDAGPEWIGLPLVLLAVNLLAAIGTNRKFRRQPALLAFHICLLALVVLAGVGRLAYFKGRIEITEGQVFDPARVEVVAQGPWHRLQLPAGLFQQGTVTVAYASGMVRGHTRSQLRLPEPSGDGEAVEVGDDRPLRYRDYRFYTTSNKGYSLLLEWVGDDGVRATGVVNLPSFPLLGLQPSQRWTTPGGETLELVLQRAEPPPEQADWTLGSATTRAVLELRRLGSSQRLQPGAVAAVGGGRVRYAGLRMWMGYRIYRDPTLPWMFAAALAAVVCLGWYFRDRLWHAPLPVAAAVEA